jgi:site-specific DNA-methyltransferase (cytosine-N4-specific)
MEIKKIVDRNLEALNWESSLLLNGDARKVIEFLPNEHYACCITSPPYWGLRDYGYEGQIGAEENVDHFIEDLVQVFAAIRPKLKADGTLWVNIGDSYTSGNRAWRAPDKKNPARTMGYRPPTPEGLKPKDLIGVPWRLAFALQQEGWYLRSDIIWYKPNCQPESVKDRPTQSHEYVFLFSKSEKYLYNHEEIKEPTSDFGALRNKRSVWMVNTEPLAEAHFATFPEELIKPIIKAASNSGDVILDPFLGSGTVGVVASKLKRIFHGIELKPEYLEIAQKRISKCQTLQTSLF